MANICPKHDVLYQSTCWCCDLAKKKPAAQAKTAPEAVQPRRFSNVA